MPIESSNAQQASQRILLEGQPNLRDLGGYQTATGRTVKPGLIYRSGELSKLTDEDLSTLHGLDIKTIVDFRSADEVEFFGEDRLPAGARYVALRLQPPNLGPALFDAVDKGDASLLPENALADANRAIISEATGQMSDFFKELSDPSHLPLLFHCTHGKDRTGIAAAILLMALGVSPEVAEMDYLQSNDCRENENEEQLAGLRQVIAASQGVAPSEADVSKFRPLFYLEPSFFAAALDEIEKQYGTFENYLENGLGINKSQIVELRQLLTENSLDLAS